MLLVFFRLAEPPTGTRATRSQKGQGFALTMPTSPMMSLIQNKASIKTRCFLPNLDLSKVKQQHDLSHRLEKLQH
jgi:hypothetical protein